MERSFSSRIAGDTEELRASHLLHRNNLVSFTRDQYNRLHIKDHGDADAALTKEDVLQQIAVIPTTSPRPGWLGKLDFAVAVNQLQKTREEEHAR
jgi:hypothetical protein